MKAKSTKGNFRRTEHHKEKKNLLQFLLPGYGTLPFVTSSVSKIPNDHTSDLIVNRPYNAASGAVHLIGNLAPANIGNTDNQFSLAYA